MLSGLWRWYQRDGCILASSLRHCWSWSQYSDNSLTYRSIVVHFLWFVSNMLFPGPLAHSLLPAFVFIALCRGVWKGSTCLFVNGTKEGHYLWALWGSWIGGSAGNDVTRNMYINQCPVIVSSQGSKPLCCFTAIWSSHCLSPSGDRNTPLTSGLYWVAIDSVVQGWTKNKTNDRKISD